MLMTGIKEKTCTKCKQTKDVSEYYKKGRGYASWCKDCYKELSRQRVLDGRDKASKEKYKKLHGIKPRKKTTKLQKTPPRKRNNKIEQSPKVTLLHKMCVEMVRNVRRRSMYLNREFDLDVDFIEEKVIEFSIHNKCDISLQKKPFKPSIDRIDNSKGYTKDNIRICWLIENLCKNTFSDDDVLEFCKRKLGLQ